VSSALTSPARQYAATSMFYPGVCFLLLSLSLAFSKWGRRVFVRSVQYLAWLRANSFLCYIIVVRIPETCLAC